MRSIGLDIHRDFCEVAIAEGGRVRAAGRIGTAPAEIEAFAGGLRPDDSVTLEATGNALAIVRILEPHVRVVLANPKATKATTRLRAKTDRIDARTLAQLLASGFLPEVWVGGEATHALRRRVGRRVHLVRQRTKAKNQVHAVLLRNLAGRPPVSDVFGTRGRAWLERLVPPDDERETLAASLRTIDFLDAEVAGLDRALAPLVLGSPDMRRLLTLPGVSATTPATLAGVIGDIARFPKPPGSWHTSGLTRGSASRAMTRPITGGSASRGHPRLATCSSRPRGSRPGRRGRCACSPNDWPPGAAGTSRSSPSPASSR